MITRTLLSRCAPLAIAASVALPAIPATAQDTASEPVIVLPEPAPVATQAPTPTIVLPDVSVAAAPVSTAEVAPADVTPSAPVTTRTVSRPATQPAPVAATPIAERATPVAAAPPAAPAAAAPALPMAVQPAPAAAVTATRDNQTSELALAGLLGLLGLGAVGGIAYAASRRRRRGLDAEPVAYEPAASATPTSAEPALARSTGPTPVFAAPAQAASAFATPVVAAATTRSPTRANGDPIPLPSEVPQTFEERDALLKQMVAAEPDRANPFTSPRARARRAKLIIQSLGRSFQSRKPRFDLSEYTNRWPALRGWQPATA